MEQTVVLTMRGITMTFPGVKALDHVDFTLRKGEIHALICLLYTSSVPLGRYSSRIVSPQRRLRSASKQMRWLSIESSIVQNVSLPASM